MVVHYPPAQCWCQSGHCYSYRIERLDSFRLSSSVRKESRADRVRRLAKLNLRPYEIRQITGESFCYIYHIRRRLKLTKLEPPRPAVELPDLNIAPKKKRGRWGPHIETLRTLKHRGASYSELGKKYGVTRERIQQLLAVETGDKCDRCGVTGRMHGHHKNYLTNESSTLCTSCHRQQHVIERDNTARFGANSGAIKPDERSLEFSP